MHIVPFITTGTITTATFPTPTEIVSSEAHRMDVQELLSAAARLLKEYSASPSAISGLQATGSDSGKLHLLRIWLPLDDTMFFNLSLKCGETPGSYGTLTLVITEHEFISDQSLATSS